MLSSTAASWAVSSPSPTNSTGKLGRQNGAPRPPPLFMNGVGSVAPGAGASAGSLLLLPLDVTDYAAMPAAVQSVVDAFGRIDMLINNAGTSQRSFCIDTDMQVYRQMLELNVLGQIALTKAVLPLMAAQGSGHILVTSSLARRICPPDWR